MQWFLLDASETQMNVNGDFFVSDLGTSQAICLSRISKNITHIFCIKSAL